MNGNLLTVLQSDVLTEVDAADGHFVRILEELVEVLVGD
jgi:hypothetical protein